jgi:hypothetical protein
MDIGHIQIKADVLVNGVRYYCHSIITVNGITKLKIDNSGSTQTLVVSNSDHIVF